MTSDPSCMELQRSKKDWMIGNCGPQFRLTPEANLERIAGKLLMRAWFSAENSVTILSTVPVVM